MKKIDVLFGIGLLLILSGILGAILSADLKVFIVGTAIGGTLMAIGALD